MTINEFKITPKSIIMITPSDEIEGIDDIYALRDDWQKQFPNNKVLVNKYIDNITIIEEKDNEFF